MTPSVFRGLHVHLIGIGGAGVSALAPLLRQAGATVSGCDSCSSPVTEHLEHAGVRIFSGHSASHLAGVDLVVHTAAVTRTHTELVAAERRGIPIMTRGTCLVQLMQGTRTIAVAGSHGKTSTTWMLGHLLSESGHDPVVMVGGSVASLGGGGARVGLGRLFIAETDESDGSFFHVEPDIAIVTNLDREHLDHWGSYDALEEAFHAWLQRLPASGTAIVPALGLSPRITAGLTCRVIRCGLETGDVFGTQVALGADNSRVRLSSFGHDLGEITVPLPGAHMVCNALMAVAAACVVDPSCNLASLAHCERVRRRFTVHGVADGIRVVEDYGHHPTEVRATIAAARLGGGRVHVLFQPHRYTRTRDCFAEFTCAFDQVHALALLPIYAASEAPLPGIDSPHLTAAIRERRHMTGVDETVADCASGLEAMRFIGTHARPGDTVLVLGAGDVGELAPKVLEYFSVRQRQKPSPLPSDLFTLV